MSTSNKSNKKKGMSANAKWGLGLFIEVIVLVLMVIGYATLYVDEKLDTIKVVEIHKENLHINEESNEAQKGYTTIALFGIDARDNTNMDAGNRSDTIMIASINNDTKEVRIVSVYRDTLLQLADGSGTTTKITHAYAYGGPELAIATLNANLDLQITDFVTVNFLALTRVIDDLGGIDVEIKESELTSLNASITEQISVTGVYSDGVWQTGLLHLNGTQATAYARIRSTDQGDITRTQRQRYIVSQIINGAKKSDMATIDNIIDDVFPNIYTSIDRKEILNLAKSLIEYELGDTIGFPMAYQLYNDDVKGSLIVPGDLSNNVTVLHKFLFDTDGYTPTDTVNAIGNSLISETGITYNGEEIQIDTGLLNY